MGPTALYALPICLSLGSPVHPPLAAERAPPMRGGYLAPEDAFLLDFIVHEFLFDPKHAVRVRVPVPVRRMQLEYTFQFRGEKEEIEFREGWLVRGSNGQPDRVYFIDGESMPAPRGKIRPLNFERQCEKRYRSKTLNESLDWGCLISELRGDTDVDDLVLAAWLHRRGYDNLAARALAAVRGDEPIHQLRTNLARRAYDSMCAAICHGADDEALMHAERLFRLYPDLIDSGLKSANAIVADLKRRQKAAHIRSADWPSDFASWNTDKKLAYLIDSLERIAPPKFSEKRREWHITDERPYAELVQLGDAAVPALIGVVERDERLTRSMVWDVQSIHFSSGFRDNRPRQFIEVRAIAQRILFEILGTRSLEPLQFSESDDDSPSAIAERLRRYWAAYGKLPFDDRLMAILTNPSARPDARQEAADVLVHQSIQQFQSWSRPTRDLPARHARPRSHLIAKYKSPTVAEAVLAALDQELARNSHWSSTESEYIGLLANLGDQRVGFELAKRARGAVDLSRRLRLAEAAYQLGFPAPLTNLAREVEAGTLSLGLGIEIGNRRREFIESNLSDVLTSLHRSELKEAHDALYALADTAHPFHALLYRLLLQEQLHRFRPPGWAFHPFVVPIMSLRLTDSRSTGVHYYLRGDEIEILEPGQRPRRYPMLGPMDRPDEWVEHAEERVADVAAEQLSEIVAGIPSPHPLRKNADRILHDINAQLDTYARRLRPMDFVERHRLDMWRMDLSFIPDIKPLGRPAADHDVKTGRAVFHLAGKGQVADQKLPAWLLLKSEAKKESPAFGLIVQAEVAPDGKPVYGVIFRHEIRAVRADEVERIEPYLTK
jgi:hypothetical protein